MRLRIAISLLLCALALHSCRRGAEEPYPFSGWSVESLRGALAADTLSPRRRMMATGDLGILHVVSGRYDSARLWLARALDMPGGRQWQGGRLITNMANSYGYEGNHTEALKWHMEALRESRRPASSAGDVRLRRINSVRTMANLAEVYYQTGNGRQALHYAEQARETNLPPEGRYLAPQYLYIIGAVHLDEGELR